MGSAMKPITAEKFQLNDLQWAKLLSLADLRFPATAYVSIRLRSNGLVGNTLQGREYLTEKGAFRISQGR